MRPSWRRWFVTVLSGGMLFQAPGCVEAASVVTAVSATIGAGGILYLVSRVLND